MTRHICVLAFACALASGAASAHAAQQDTSVQTDEEPGSQARFRIGALRFTPTLQVTNVGVDSNVFNDTTNNVQDTTGAVGPAVNLWLKMGKSRLSGKTSGQYIYFNKYDNQRAWNTANDGRWELPLARLTPFVTGALSNTKDRPGYEIDSRVRQNFRSGGFGTSVRLSGKTNMVLTAQRATTAFADNDVFLGARVANSLNRRTDTEEMRVGFRLTPLTTFLVRAQATQERFDTEPDRNADTISVMPGFDLQPQALVSGSVFVGVKRFNALRDQIPDFTGVVSNVHAKYAAHSTLLDLRVTRDIAYSYQVEQPYYAVTDVGVTITERVTTKWDLLARGSHQAMAYRNLATATLASRTDRSWTGGGGVGYRLGQSVRIGFDANYYRRTSSSVALRDYTGFRFGASFSYGLTQ